MKISMTPLLLVSSLALASTAIAAEPAQEGDTTLHFQGVKVAIDPVTGRLRQPTAAESAALKAAVAKMPTQQRGKAMPKTRAEANRTVRKMRDGSVSMSVSEDMLLDVVATRQPDGTIRIQHQGEAATQEANHE